MHSKNQRRHGSPMVPVRTKAPLAHGTISPSQPKPFRAPRDGAHSPFTRPPRAVYPPKAGRGRPCVSLPVVSLEKMPGLGRTDGAHVRLNCSTSTMSSSSSSSSSAMPKPSHKPQDRVLNGRIPSLPLSAPNRRPGASPSSTMDKRPSSSPCPVDRRPSSSPCPVDRRPSSSPCPVDRRPSSSPCPVDRRPSLSPCPVDRRPSSSPCPVDRRPTSSPSPSPSPSSLDRRPSALPPPLDKKHQNGTKAGKPYKRMSARVFDPNKHCGVLDPETKRPCTRSLTCKTHSLTHRRAVPGRKNLFDWLLAEHKGRLKEKEKEKEVQPPREPQRGRDPAHSLPSQSLDPLNNPSTNCRNGKTTSPSKARPLCTYIPRIPGSKAGVGPNGCPSPAPDMVALGVGTEGCGRPSSEEEEVALPDESERPDCHCSPAHPRPSGCCSFGSRLMGQGHYVFDRRWDRTRLALHRMVAKHVSSLMWRKIPLANESPAPSLGANLVAQSFPSPSPSGSHSVTPPLLSPPTTSFSQSDGVSVASYAATFPPSGGGVFSVVDSASPPAAPFPAPFASPSRGGRGRARPSRPTKAPDRLPGVTEGGAAQGRRKKLPPSYAPQHKRNSLAPPHPGGPAYCSNGTPRPSAKTPPSPHLLPGDHAPAIHGPLPFSTAYGRKRKGSGPAAGPGKTTKAPGLSGVFRKGGPEPPHASPLPRQPAVHR